MSFPPLRPTSRAWQVGAPPVAVHRSLAGVETRVRLGSASVGGNLSLAFANRNESEVASILEHFRQMNGTLASFQLPSQVFAGMTSGALNYVDTLWRYAGPPAVDWVAPGVGTCSIELSAVVA